MPEGEEWLLWRLFLHPKVKETQIEIENEWDLDRVVRTHDVLDAIEAAEAQAREQQG